MVFFFIDHDEPQTLKDTIKRSFDDSVSWTLNKKKMFQ